MQFSREIYFIVIIIALEGELKWPTTLAGRQIIAMTLWEG
jgi:hypothetical protein